MNGARSERARTRKDSESLCPYSSAVTLLSSANAEVLDRIEKALHEAHGLNSSEYAVLSVLDQADEGRLRMQELAESVGLSPSGVTRLVERLERKGFVERLACQSDKRSVWATLTEKGRDKLEAATPLYRSTLRKLLAPRITEDEARLLAGLLRKVRG